MDESSDEDVEATFEKIRNSLLQNKFTDSTETTNRPTEKNSSKISNKEKNRIVYKTKLEKSKSVSEDSDMEEDTTRSINRVPLNESDKETSLNKSYQEANSIKKVVGSHKRRILDSSDSEAEISQISMESQLKNSDTEEIGSTKNKVILKNSDSEGEIDTTKSKITLEDSDSEEESDNIIIKSRLKNNIVHNVKRKPVLDSSDSEEDISYVAMKSQLENSDTEEISSTKNKVTLRDSDSEEESNDIIKSGLKNNIAGNVRQKPALDSSDSEEEIIHNPMESQLEDIVMKEVDSNKRKIGIIGNSDSEEEISSLVKKNKYINDDSD